MIATLHTYDSQVYNCFVVYAFGMIGLGLHYMDREYKKKLCYEEASALSPGYKTFDLRRMREIRESVCNTRFSLVLGFVMDELSKFYEEIKFYW